MFSLRTRRIIALTFIVAFLITAPILILYTAGYRYSFKKQKVSLTGTLVLESTPKNATVHLNGTAELFHTPARLTNLFPNEYHITVDKDGYFSWQKTLPVTTQTTTFAENIVLFKKSTPDQITDQPFTDVVVAPNHKWAGGITFTEEKGSMVSVFTGKTLLPIMSATHMTAMMWSPDSEFLLITEQTDVEKTLHVFAISTDNARAITLPSLTISTNAIIRWMSTKNNTFSIFDQQQVREVTINPEWNVIEAPVTVETTYTFAPTQHILDCFVTNHSVYYIEQSPIDLILSLRDLNDTAEKKIYPTITLPLHGVYDFKPGINNHIVLTEVTSNTTYLITNDLSSLPLERHDLIGMEMNNEKKLLVFDDSEIAIGDLAQTPIPLSTVTRLSEGITYAQWYKDLNYILFVQNNQIQAIELDSRDVRNVTTLTTEPIVAAFANPNGKELYFTSTTKPGIFRLELAE
jgi:hypothetical protein